MAAPLKVIDCDVHCAVPTREALYPYLPRQFHEFLEWGAPQARTPAGEISYPSWLPMLATAGAELTLEVLRERVLDQGRTAILNCYFGVESFPHPYYAPALATAVNRWLQDEWLDRDDRLYASAVVAPQHTEAAVEEVHRIAADPRFVQIVLPVRVAEPYGQQRYWPIWEAAAEHGLVVALTYGGEAGWPPTPVGWLGSFYEHYATAPTAFQSHILSLVASGLFVDRPALRFVVMESGWTWLPAFLWRFDEHWRALRREVPWLHEPPSATIRRHFRFTTQPVDAPSTAVHLREIIEQIGGPELLMFGSDYPHEYGDDGIDLLAQLTPAEAERMLGRTAREWYGVAGPT